LTKGRRNLAAAYAYVALPRRFLRVYPSLRKFWLLLGGNPPRIVVFTKTLDTAFGSMIPRNFPSRIRNINRRAGINRGDSSQNFCLGLSPNAPAPTLLE
jgi:hypothetical protein